MNTRPQDGRVDILLGTPTLGMIRVEWHNAMNGMVSPPNWALVRSTPIGYTVPDAQNMLVHTMLYGGKFRALLLIEDDTMPPPNAILNFDRWFWKMERKKAPPIVSGLYHIKGSAEIRAGDKGGIQMMGPEPLAYRGPGGRAYRDWKYGDVIWVSGVPTGALMIHRSVLEAWYREADVDTYSIPGYPHPVKRVFAQPSRVWIDEHGGAHSESGTSDLYFSSETIKRDILTKAGWPTYAKRDWPYVIDTAMVFGHIDRETGRIY